MSALDYEMFFQNSMEMMCVLGLDGRFKKVNRAFVNGLGFSESELLDTPYLEIVHEDDRPSTIDQIRQLAEGGNAVLFGIRVRGKDARYRWIEWNCPAVAKGSQVFYPIGRDLTERKLAEERQQAVFERLQKMVEAVPEAILLVNRDGAIIHSNTAAERLFEYSKKELDLLPIEQLVPAPLRSLHTEFRQTYTRQPSARPMGSGRQLAGVAKSGKSIAIEISLMPIDTAAGPIVMAAIVDLARQQQQDEQRRHVQAYLSAAPAPGGAPIPSICCFCKRVKENEREWENVEHWMMRRYNLAFSGAYCPECVIKHYPEYAASLSQ